MATDCLIAATVIGEDAVVVAKARPAEWSESAIGNQASIEARLSALLGQSVKVLRLLRATKVEMLQGLTFQEFREAWREPACFYECASCGQGESAVVEVLEVTAFKATGGKVHLHL